MSLIVSAKELNAWNDFTQRLSMCDVIVAVIIRTLIISLCSYNNIYKFHFLFIRLKELFPYLSVFPFYLRRHHLHFGSLSFLRFVWVCVHDHGFSKWTRKKTIHFRDYHDCTSFAYYVWKIILQYGFNLCSVIFYSKWTYRFDTLESHRLGRRFCHTTAISWLFLLHQHINAT